MGGLEYLALDHRRRRHSALFGGRGKISEMMGDIAKGIKAFKKGLSDEDTASAEPRRDPKSIDHQPSSTVRRDRKEGRLNPRTRPRARPASDAGPRRR